jgi:hypothetical protein
MTSTPDQPQPGSAQPRPAQPADFEPDPSLGYPEWDQDGQVLGPSLTMAEIAELNRLDGDPGDDDPEYWDDPERGAPPEWLALSSSEQARLVEEACARPEVPEAIAAGFTHRYGGSGTGSARAAALMRCCPARTWPVTWGRRCSGAWTRCQMMS